MDLTCLVHDERRTPLDRAAGGRDELADGADQHIRVVVLVAVLNPLSTRPTGSGTPQLIHVARAHQVVVQGGVPLVLELAADPQLHARRRQYAGDGLAHVPRRGVGFGQAQHALGQDHHARDLGRNRPGLARPGRALDGADAVHAGHIERGALRGVQSAVRVVAFVGTTRLEQGGVDCFGRAEPVKEAGRSGQVEQRDVERRE